MKKFYTSMPLQKNDFALYQAVGNPRLQLDHKTYFPIIAALEGYTDPGDEVAVIAVYQDVRDSRYNLGLFRNEVEDLCKRRNLHLAKLEVVEVPNNEHVSTYVSTFQRLLDYAEDGDELFCCMTYGTKPLSTAMMMAIQYAYRVKQNTTISCIVYGHVLRPDFNDRSTWEYSIYDMTALVQLDEIVRVLADRKVENPKAVIDRILKL